MSPELLVLPEAAGGVKVWPSRPGKERGFREGAAATQQKTQNPNSGANTSEDILSYLKNNYSINRVKGDSTETEQKKYPSPPLEFCDAVKNQTGWFRSWTRAF